MGAPQLARKSQPSCPYALFRLCGIRVDELGFDIEADVVADTMVEPEGGMPDFIPKVETENVFMARPAVKLTVREV